ncbi:hypothetical protein ACIP3B_28335 [Streptomyces anulatus]|uniref:hypothetical protein n=1 Tax=Streptomyces anulatus TaxID=1892 RepID=UPI003404CBBF
MSASGVHDTGGNVNDCTQFEPVMARLGIKRDGPVLVTTPALAVIVWSKPLQMQPFRLFVLL